MIPLLLYIAMMLVSGYIAYRLLAGLRAGLIDREVWLGPRWHVHQYREPLTFLVTMCLWLALLAFVVVLMGGMTYGLWTGQWSR